MLRQKTVPLLSKEKRQSNRKEKKKKVSYTPGAFPLNKILDFLVTAEERDKATLKTC